MQALLIADVAGVAGTYSVRLARLGYELSTLDLRPRNVEKAGRAAAASGVALADAGQVEEASNIRDSHVALTIDAGVFICGMTLHNANVLYGFGILQADHNRSTTRSSAPAPSVEADPSDVAVVP